jgi:hypothetical protein
MVSRAVKNEAELSLLLTYLKGRKRPFTVEITEGRSRSIEANKLAFKWYGEISDQTGEDREDVRARCKLMFGVPILRQDNEKFRETYDRLIKPLSYPEKLAIIRDTEMPVTSLMKVDQMSLYLDIVFRRHAEDGIALTVPEDRFAYNPEKTRRAAA